MKVTVIIPSKNEKEHIEECIDSIIKQNYPSNMFEILIVDGMSTDGTREIISEKYLNIYSNIHLLDNIKEITPVALNIGIRHAIGDIIIIISAHASMDQDFIFNSVKALEKHPEVDCVGGRIQSVNNSYISKAISLAMSCPFGVGNALFRYANQKRYVDTVAFGAYRRNVFDMIGLFDEQLVRGQDFELNYRIIKNNGKILMDPSIKSKYYTRTSLTKLWKQYFQYGFWKVYAIKKHKSVASIRHLVPSIFILTLIGTGLFGLYFSFIKHLFYFIVLSYIFGSITYSLKLALKNSIIYAPILPIIFFILHIGYGIGFLLGIIDFYVFNGALLSNRNTKLSR